MNDPDYHPHYPDRANDYFLRLMNNAKKFADHRRLAFFDYANWEIVDGKCRLKVFGLEQRTGDEPV